MNNRIASLGELSGGSWIVFYHTDTTPTKAGNSGTFTSLGLAQAAQVLWIRQGIMSHE